MRKSKKEEVDRYCVILPTMRDHSRAWFNSCPEALVHASRLANDNPHNSSLQKLLVVKVVKVVCRAEPPVEIRPPHEEDFYK